MTYARNLYDHELIPGMLVQGLDIHVYLYHRVLDSVADKEVGRLEKTDFAIVVGEMKRWQDSEYVEVLTKLGVVWAYARMLVQVKNDNKNHNALL